MGDNPEPNLMLLQTNSYVVPSEKRSDHARLMRRFRQAMHRIGCDSFEVYEQAGPNWSNNNQSAQATGRFVQIMRFRDRKHQLAVQNAERSDPGAQQLIAEFCELVNFPYQQERGLFVVGFYTSVLPVAPVRVGPAAAAASEEAEDLENGTADAAPDEIPAPSASQGVAAGVVAAAVGATIAQTSEVEPIAEDAVDAPQLESAESVDSSEPAESGSQQPVGIRFDAVEPAESPSEVESTEVADEAQEVIDAEIEEPIHVSHEEPDASSAEEVIDSAEPEIEAAAPEESTVDVNEASAEVHEGDPVPIAINSDLNEVPADFAEGQSDAPANADTLAAGNQPLSEEALLAELGEKRPDAEESPASNEPGLIEAATDDLSHLPANDEAADHALDGEFNFEEDLTLDLASRLDDENLHGQSASGNGHSDDKHNR